MDFKYKKESMIGLMVVVTVAILFFGINYLKGINMMRPTNYYYAKFADVKGLLESSSITSRGYGVGHVHEIDYNYADPTDGVVVILQLDDELTIPKGSKVLLNTGLMGGASLALDLNFDGSGKYYKRGDTIASLAVPGVLDAVTEEVMPRVAELIPQLDSLIISLRTVSENKALVSALNNFSDASLSIKKASGKLDVMMDRDIAPFMQDAKAIAANMNTMTTNLSQVDFKLTFNKVNSTLESVSGLADEMQNGKGTISLLLKDPALYNNLTSATNNASSLLQDLERNPKRYVQFSLIQRKEKKDDKREDK